MLTMEKARNEAHNLEKKKCLRKYDINEAWKKTQTIDFSPRSY